MATYDLNQTGLSDEQIKQGLTENGYGGFLNNYEGVRNAYQTSLGRAPRNIFDYQSWISNPNYISEIANSDEARAYANRSAMPTVAAPSGGGSSAPNYGGTTAFNDPATQSYEDLLNKLIPTYTTPYQNPAFQQAIDQMNTYLGKLNGPAYTPDQMNLIQTQAINPIYQQRDAARQQLTQRLAAQGIGPSSGIAQKAMEDLDTQFAGLDTQTRANFATQAVGLDRQNALAAAQLAPQIAQMYTNQYQQQLQNQLQGLNLASIIPNMAWNRLLGANSAVQQLNPASLFTNLYGFQNQAYGQNADYLSQLMQAIIGAFGG